MTDLLTKAGAGEYATITAVAGDGYAIEVNKDELENAIVALKENGKWIAETDPDHGPIRLVTPKTPANRWVFQLQEIQVNQEGGSGVPANAALKVTGNVKVEVGWTEEKVRSMDTIQAESTNKQGETKTYTGVLHQRPAGQGRSQGRRDDAGLCRRRWLYRRGAPGRCRGVPGLHRLVPRRGRL